MRVSQQSWLSITVLILPSMTMAFAGGWGPPRQGSSSSSSSSSTALTRTTSSTRWQEQRKMDADVSSVLSLSASSTLNGDNHHHHQAATAEKNNNNNNNNIKTKDVLSLQSIRNSLIRQEETIIFALIERAQYRQNSIVYQKGGFGNLGIPAGSTAIIDNADEGTLSFLEYMLVGTEALHCGVRRYTSPEEHAFFPERLPKQGQMEALPLLQYPQDLLSAKGGASDVNFNKILLSKYMDIIVPSVADVGDDEQHGSTVLADIAVLQALSRRIHYGKFVAESKYRSDPEGYQKLVEAGDADGVMALLTNKQVEKQVLKRSRMKAAAYGTEPMMLPTSQSDNDETNMVAAAAATAVVATMDALRHEKMKGKVDPGAIESVYRDIIIPMTKDVEVAYLFLRCGKEPPPEYRP